VGSGNSHGSTLGLLQGQETHVPTTGTLRLRSGQATGHPILCEDCQTWATRPTQICATIGRYGLPVPHLTGMDTLSPRQRSAVMGRIRSKNTAPEMTVRKLVHGMGYRYRLHKRSLPGTPDLVFPARKRVIFVHGCFWHKHAGCVRLPKSKMEYWKPKLEGNRRRDLSVQRKLRSLGWKALIIWECEVREKDLAERIASFLTEDDED
jgi:DNA mismatch endonuclease, patch repair protein